MPGCTGNNVGPIRREYAALASRYDTRWKSYASPSVRETLKPAHNRPGNPARYGGHRPDQPPGATPRAVPQGPLAPS